MFTDEGAEHHAVNAFPLKVAAGRGRPLSATRPYPARFRPAMRNALSELPALRLAVHLDQESRVVLAVIPEIDAIPSKFGLQEIQPGEVHVDGESLEGPDLGRVVIKPGRQARLVAAGLSHVPVLLRASHSASLSGEYPGSKTTSHSSEASHPCSPRPRAIASACSIACMVALQIRDVPEELRDRLSELAGQRGQSLQAYLFDVISDEARRQDNLAVLSRFAKGSHGTRLSPDDIGGALQAGRAERDAELGVTAAGG